jgi:hypothetical protein
MQDTQAQKKVEPVHPTIPESKPAPAEIKPPVPLASLPKKEKEKVPCPEVQPLYVLAYKMQ